MTCSTDKRWNSRSVVFEKWQKTERWDSNRFYV